MTPGPRPELRGGWAGVLLASLAGLAAGAAWLHFRRAGSEVDDRTRRRLQRWSD